MHFKVYLLFNKLLNSRQLSAFLCLCLFSNWLHAGWERTWIDDFSGDSVDWNNWTAQTTANYNNEVQCYTDDESSDLRNYEVSNGTLKIIARRQPISCPGQNGRALDWTSGRLNSKDKAEFTFGRIEARLRFDELRAGTWPAFWMLENRIAEQPINGDNDTVNWPNPGAGEIDIWEWYGANGNSVITNFFNANNCGSETRYNYPGGSPDVQSFNVYAIEYDANSIEFYFNDMLVASHDLRNCPQYEEPMFLLLNVAMGGNIGGQIDSSLDKATLEVDYVAHCVPSDKNQLSNCNKSTPQIADDDNDGVSNESDQCPNTPINTTVDKMGCQIRTMPSSGAPLPLNAADTVVSIFSEQYQNIEAIDYFPNWGQVTQFELLELDNNPTLNYNNMNYQGIDFEGAPQDLSAMNYLNLSYWTHNSTKLEVFVISPGPRENAVGIELKQGEWQGVSIPLSQYTSPDLSSVFQLKFEGNGSFFFDNIFFSQQASFFEEQETPLPTAPEPSEPSDLVSSDEQSNGGSLHWSVLFVLGLVPLRRIKH
jgi:beta-glucanase (GH16 family)